MEAEAAKYIGAGIACIALAGAGISIGTIFGNYLAGLCATRQRHKASSRTCFWALHWQRPQVFSA